MEVTFERTINETWLILPEEVPPEEYACRLLERNPGRRLLKLKRRKGKKGMEYAFSIPQGNSLAGLFRLRPMSFQEIARIMSGISLAVEEAEDCLLDPDHLVLTPELIFAMPDLDHISLCCHPGFRGDFFEQLRELIRYFLRKMDHQDREGTEAAYRLFEISEQEYFRFEDLMSEIGRIVGDAPAAEAPPPPAPKGRTKREDPLAREDMGERRTEEEDSGSRIPEAVLLTAGTFFLLLFFWIRFHREQWEFRALALSLLSFALLLALTLLSSRKRRRGKMSSRREGDPESDQLRKNPEKEDSAPETRPGYPRRGQQEWKYCLIPLQEGWEEGRIDRFPFTIGKMRGEADLLLDLPEISRIQARITRKGTELSLTDCRSVNGTFVNGFQLQPDSPYPLRQGDEIRFADIPFRLEAAPQPAHRT